MIGFYLIISMLIGFLFRQRAKGMETLYFLIGVFSFYLPGTIISYMYYNAPPYKFIGFAASVFTTALVYYLLTRTKKDNPPHTIIDSDILDDMDDWE